MSKEFLLVSKEEMEALGKLVDQLNERITAILGTSGTLTLTRVATDLPQQSGQDDDGAEPISGKHVIRPGGLSYADVVDREVHRNAFSLDEAWEIIGPRIIARSPRVRESLKRSLDGDERFFKSSSGVYIRRETIPEYEQSPDLPF